MILITLFIVFIGLLVLSAYFDSEDSGTFFFCCSAIILIVCIIIPIVSYDNYVNLKSTYIGVISQYSQALTIYEDRAIITIDEKTFTDLRYQGYQEQLGKFISQLRNKITRYNMKYTSKSIYENNILWGWLIFGPDEDMKLMQLNEQVK